jgi:N-acetylglucosamine kinase-like BadF-type ATPase
MDMLAVSETVAKLMATGAVQGLGKDAASRLLTHIIARVREVFGNDACSTSALKAVESNRDHPASVAELAAALRRYAEQNNQFATELADWAHKYKPGDTAVIQNIHSSGDSYTAGRDITINKS